MHRFENIQRRAVKILYKLKRRMDVSITSLMISLGLLPFHSQCKFRLLCITQRAIYRSIPEYLATLISIHSDSRPRHSGSTMVLHQPITSTRFFEAAFAVAVPKYWNLLPTDIRITKSESLFKRKLYKYFLYL